MNQQLRQLIRERTGHSCEYCHLSQAVASFAQFQVEHIRAKQHGGTDASDNLALACPRCNAFKGPNLSAIDPLTHEVTLLYHPRQLVWEDHFAQIGIEIIGITPIGRCTVDLLKMNEEERMRLREAMIDSE